MRAGCGQAGDQHQTARSVCVTHRADQAVDARDIGELEIRRRTPSHRPCAVDDHVDVGENALPRWSIVQIERFDRTACLKRPRRSAPGPDDESQLVSVRQQCARQMATDKSGSPRQYDANLWSSLTLADSKLAGFTLAAGKKVLFGFRAGQLARRCPRQRARGNQIDMTLDAEMGRYQRLKFFT